MKKLFALFLALAMVAPVTVSLTSCSPGYHSGPSYRPHYGAYGTSKKMKHARRKIVTGH